MGHIAWDKKFLDALDGSDHSGNALGFVIKLANSSDAELVMIRVVAVS